MASRRIVFSCLPLLVYLSLFLGCPDPKPPSGKCQSNDDCKADSTKKICDRNKEACVQCIKNEDCQTGEVCDLTTSACRKGCSKDDDCKNAFPARPTAKVGCALATAACIIKCDSHDECAPDEICQQTQCIKGQRPVENLPGKYASCEKEGKCQGSLECLSYKGGSVRYCWKKCSLGCDPEEVCVKAERFADGHDVCMKKVTVESGEFNYDQGTACDDGLLPLAPANQPQYGTCWKDCTTKCLDTRQCHNHPNVDDANVKLCFLPCKSDTECPKGSRCREHKKANNDFYCF